MEFLSSRTVIGLTWAELFALVGIITGSVLALVDVKTDIAAATITANNIEKIHIKDVNDLKDLQKDSYEGLRDEIKILQKDVKQILREMK